MNSSIRKTAVILLVFLLIWLSIRYFLPLIFPFLLGAALALGAEPMASFLHKRLKLPRGAAAGIGVTAAICFTALLLLLVCALIVREVGILANMIPNLEQAADSGLSILSNWLLGLIARLPTGIRDILTRNVSEFFSGSADLLDQAFRYVLNLASGVLSQVPDGALILGTGILSGYMISAKLPAIKQWFQTKIPSERIRKLFATLKQMKSVIFSWLKAQLKLMGVTFLILTMGFVILRIPYAPLWAAAISLVDAFPVLGTGTVLLPWSLISFLKGNTAQAIGLLGTYAAASLSRSILEPKLVGRQLGLDPLLTLAAIYIGYRIWGLGGMLLAPMLAVTALQVLHVPEQTDN